MKSIVKTTLALTVLLTVTGCWDFGWSKKHQENESAEAATPSKTGEHSSKCTHKGCKDKHHDEVQTQQYMQGQDTEYMSDEVRLQRQDAVETEAFFDKHHDEVQTQQYMQWQDTEYMSDEVRLQRQDAVETEAFFDMYHVEAAE